MWQLPEIVNESFRDWSHHRTTGWRTHKGQRADIQSRQHQGTMVSYQRDQPEVRRGHPRPCQPLLCHARGLAIAYPGGNFGEAGQQFGFIAGHFQQVIPRCKKVPVSWDAVDDSPGKGNHGVGCFFSGDLDSFYTYNKHESEIDTLVLVHGFDNWLDVYEIRRQIPHVLQGIAGKLGKPLIEVETNLHEFTKRFIHWGLQGFGSGLASVAILLSSHLNEDIYPCFRKLCAS